MTTSTAAGNAARTHTRPDGLLRLALRLDAVVTGLNGAAYLVAAALLDGPLGLSTGLLRWVGAFLLAYAAAVWLVGTRARPSTSAVEAVVVLNGLWAVGSVVVVLTDRSTPTTVGAVWLVLQALVVAGFAAVQQQFPGFVFQAAGPADAHHDQVRFTWELGLPGEEDPVSGFDVAVVDGSGRIRTVLGFLDRVPAAA